MTNEPRINATRIEYNGRAIGEYKERNGQVSFKKYVNPKKHFFYKYQGYGIQKSIFDKLLSGKQGVIVIQETEGERRKFIAEIYEWAASDIRVNFNPFGEQIILPINKMKQVKI